MDGSMRSGEEGEAGKKKRKRRRRSRGERFPDGAQLSTGMTDF